MSVRWLLLFLLCLAPPAIQTGVSCRVEIKGITYCAADRGETYLLIVDLTNPYLRVQTAMANDVLDVWPPEEQRERVVDLARRYQPAGLVIALNGDYFGDGRGPEGPTVVDGQRLDTPATISLNPSQYRRTTLTTSRSGGAAIVHLPPDSALPSSLYGDLIFNAISGGPIILYNKVILPESLACWLDGIPVATCRHPRQTAVGVDERGTTLYLAVSTTRSTHDMAELLREQGAATALKLDAGSSSQLWYRGRTLLNSRRGVANALLIFRESRSRHAAKLMARPPVVLLSPGESAVIETTWQNEGHLAWRNADFYGLRLIEGAALPENFVRLPGDVAPAQTAAISLRLMAAQPPGVYESRWQLGTPLETFGPILSTQVVIVPPDADELRQQIQPLLTRLTRLSDSAFARDWPKTAQKIRQLISTWQAARPR